MKSAVQYLTNEAGERTAVVVAYAAWEKLQRQQHQLRQKLQIMQGIRAGFTEVKAARAAGKALPMLREFLDASDDAG